ncbi:Ig-like domain-containing protein [Patescibacteria group bacterium]
MIFQKQPALSLTLLTASIGLLASLVFFYNSVAYSATDIDGDGYANNVDCVDSTYSVFKDNTSCDETDRHTLFESYNDPDGANDIADHTWIQDDDGLWHVFFQWNLQGASLTLGTDIGHFTSTDLKDDFTIVGDGMALENDTSTYYDSIWAPHIIRNGDTYYMYFTGVENKSGGLSRQRIGLATSTNLTDWTMYPVNKCAGTSGNGCIYECDNAWTTWGDGGAFDEQCRDPMIIRDEANNRWLMLNTVKYQDDSGATIDIAESTNLINWTGLGYVKAARKLTSGQGGVGQQTTGGQAENPFITEHNGKYYLIFSDWGDDEGTWQLAHNQYAASDTLDFDASGSLNWEYEGPIPIMGVNANEVIKPFDDTWIISGSISNDNSGYIGDDNRSLILRRMEFNDANDGWTEGRLTDLDCRVASSEINPGAAEICNDGLDNNCSGTADEDSVCATSDPDPDPDPDPEIIGPADVTLNNSNAKTGSSFNKVVSLLQKPTFSGTAESNATITLTVYSDPLVYSTTSDDSGNWSITVTDNIPKGNHDAYVTVTKSGESTTATKIADFSVESDNYLPIPTIVTPAKNQWLINDQPTIEGFARSANTIKFYVDGSLIGTTTTTDHYSGTGSFSYVLPSALETGRHSLAIEATDVDGNFSSRSESFNFYIGLPTIGPTLFEINSNTAAISGIGWGDTDVKVYANDTEVDEFYIGGSGTQSFTYTLPSLALGTYRLTMRAYDADDKPSNLSNELLYFGSGGSAPSVSVESPTPAVQDTAGTTHIVQSGDSMWSIAQQYYGDGNQYNRIVEANISNHPSLATNPSLIGTGWELVIP